MNSHNSRWGTPLYLAFSELADEVIAADLEEPKMDFDSSVDREIENTTRLLAKVDELVTGSLFVRLRKKRLEKRLDLVRLLVEKKADMNARRAGGTSVLHDALKRDDRALVDFLIAQGATDQEGEECHIEEVQRCRVGPDGDGDGSKDGK